MKINVINIKKHVVQELDASFLKIEKVRYDLIMQVISWQLSKKRVAIASTKSVSSIVGSTRKIYSQKGTGNARHGSLKRNIFRGGADSFAPKSNRVYKYSLNKKLRKLALKHSICHKLYNKNLFIYDNFKSLSHKTSYFLQNYRSMLSAKTLIVDSVFDNNFSLSCRNISRVNTLNINGINVYDIMNNSNICFSLRSFIVFKGGVS